MRIAKILNNDLANGPNLRTSIFISGCEHKCPECHNPHLWDFNVGKECNKEMQWTIVKALTANGIYRDLSVLGGEPLHPDNIEPLADLLRNVKIVRKDTQIWVWTGYRMEELQEKKFCGILSLVDVIIDGRFVPLLKKDCEPWRGSANQHLYKKNEKGIFEFIN